MQDLTDGDLLNIIDTGAEYDVGYYAEGQRPTEVLLYRGKPLAELLDRLREHWALHGTAERFKAKRDTDNGTQIYELNLLDDFGPGPYDRRPAV